MRNQNISKLCGEWGIKLKNKILHFLYKIWKAFQVVFILWIALICCILLYDLFDNVWNGLFVDIFTNTFTRRENVYYPDQDVSIVVRNINWTALKRLIFFLLCAVVLTGTGIVMMTAYISGKRKSKKAIANSAQMIHAYMSQERDADDIFPNEYAAISTQMSEIKTHMIRNEQLLKDEAARKNDLITYLAHDLKTPLTSVIGYLSLLDEASDMPEKQREKYIGISLDKAMRLEKLINEFFEITRYNLQQIVLEKEMTDISYMLVQMTDEFYPVLKRRGNSVELKAEEDLSAYVDAEKMARVFNNILKNAVSYSYPNTVIEITAKHFGNELMISFSNKGKTIPRHRLESIFEKFFRLDDARATNSGGAGLGLAIAKEIVTLHGGEIMAKSEDEVTTFVVKLPI